MIYSTATVQVNPQGEAPLTRHQAWAGLVLKARDARLFLPPGLCTYCEVVEESNTHIVREATIAGTDLREIIAFEPEGKVTFFQATGPRDRALTDLSGFHGGTIARADVAKDKAAVPPPAPLRPLSFSAA